MDVTISVIIPTHRRGGYLREALESVTAQSTAPLEIVVASDVQDDDTRDVCTSFQSNSSIPLTFIEYADGGGASESRNRAAAAASGSHLALLDDDDTWEPLYLETATQALRASGEDMVVTWIRMFKGDKVKRGPEIKPGLTAPDVVAINAGTTGSNMLLSTSAFSAIGGFDAEMRMKNDTDFFFRYLKSGRRYAVVPQALVNQRKHDTGQLTGHSAARADFTERYARKHQADLTRSDRRHLRFVVHRIRRHSAATPLARAYHLAAALANYSPRQYRIDRAHSRDKDFYSVPTTDSVV